MSEFINGPVSKDLLYSFAAFSPHIINRVRGLTSVVYLTVTSSTSWLKIVIGIDIREHMNST